MTVWRLQPFEAHVHSPSRSSCGRQPRGTPSPRALALALALLMGSFPVDVEAMGTVPPSDFGPLEGKILDADTKEPIEGVVVLIKWEKVAPIVRTAAYCDARETVTDSKGEFSVPRIWPMNPLFSFYAYAVIYKSGYGVPGLFNRCCVRGLWKALVGAIKDDPELKEYFHESEWRKYFWQWEDGKPVFLLRKLTPELRKTYSPPPRLWHVPLEKKRIYLEEINKERRFLGKGDVTDW